MILAQDVVRISKLKSSLSEMYDNVNTSQFCFSLLYGIRFLSFQIYKKCCQHFMERKYVTILSPQQNTGKKASLFTSSLKAIKPVKYDLFKDILLPSDSKLLAACQGKQ